MVNVYAGKIAKYSELGIEQRQKSWQSLWQNKEKELDINLPLIFLPLDINLP